MKFTNIVRFFVASLLIACALTSSANEATKRFDERSQEFDYTQSRKDWLKSWHSNEVYFTQTEYLFDCQLKAVVHEAAPWWKRAFAWASNKVIEEVSRGRFEGKAIIDTFVSHEYPNLRLLREYAHTESEALWSDGVTAKNEVVKDACAVLFGPDGEDVREIVNQSWDFIPIDDNIKGWGKVVSDIVFSICDKLFGKCDENGVYPISGESKLGQIVAKQREVFNSISGMAMQLNKDLNEKSIAMAYDGTHQIQAREMQKVRGSSKNPHTSVSNFDRYLAQGVPVNKTIENALKRESMTPTEDLFGGEVRKVDDVWVVDASVFNNFLHPDLRGAISGKAVLRYFDNVKNGYTSIVSGTTVGETKQYDIRIIEVIPVGVINGRKVQTDFSYDETKSGGSFKASYDSNSTIEIYVDEKSNHIVYGRIHFRAKNVEVLPSLALTQGFKGSGWAILDLTLNGDVYEQALK